MSDANVGRMRQAFAAFERGDKDTWQELFDPEIEVVPIGDWPEGQIRGRDAAWQFFVAIDDHWDPGSYDLSEVTESDDHVAARMRRHLRGKSSRVEVEYDYWIVLTFREGQVTRAEWFEGRREALAAAGLSV